MMSKRFTFTMSDSLAAAVDEFAEANNISRAAAVSVLCSQSLQQTQALNTMRRMVDYVDRAGQLPKVSENEDS